VKGGIDEHTGRDRDEARIGTQEARRDEGFEGFGPIHLAACLGAGITALVAVNLIELLTPPLQRSDMRSTGA
jgi:hypothetical protein